jgi:hypothetical protein
VNGIGTYGIHVARTPTGFQSFEVSVAKKRLESFHNFQAAASRACFKLEDALHKLRSAETAEEEAAATRLVFVANNELAAFCALYGIV